MQSYINQLLEDMEQAQRKDNSVEEKAPAFPKTIEEEFEEIERWLHSEPVQTLGYYCGLEKIQFPPAEMLTKRQMQQLSKAFMKLLFSWNLEADFPAKLPLAKKYSMLTGLLNEKTDIVNNGFMIFDFCSGDPGSCPFELYCPCKKWKHKRGSGEEMDSTPF